MRELCSSVASWGSVSGRPAASVRRPRRHCRVALALLAGLVTLPACHNPLVQRRLAERRQSLAFAADALTWRDRAAGQRLQRDFAYIGKDVADDAQQFRRDIRALDAYLQFDVRRFQERQDDYARKLLEILRGKPENLEPTAILMFF